MAVDFMKSGYTGLAQDRITSAHLPSRTPALRKDFKQRIPELLELERLIRQYPEWIDVQVEHQLVWENCEFPLYSLTIGNQNTHMPCVLLTGGMHGLERIGSQVLIAWLQTLLEKLCWDKCLQQQMTQLQLVMLPILNPVGMYLNQRSNGRGVDLNRNAPVNAEARVPWLGGGHRLSSLLPWYRGRKGATMEEENLALERVMKRQVFNRPMSLILDLHSGFGMQDQLWFPHACRHAPIENIAEYIALKMLWERTYPNHTYQYEPQSIHYLSHGDVWDYFYQQSRDHYTGHFLPLTLEMGSWVWVKKHPRQLFNVAGLFNPQIQHRHSRVLRRHLLLLDFMLAAAINHNSWLPDSTQSASMVQTANNLWFS